MSARPPRDALDEQLRRAAQALAYPPTPDIAAAAGGRLRQAEAARRSARRRQLAWAALIALLLGAALAVPQVRAALRSLLQVGAVRIETVAEPPLPPGATPAPVPADSLLNLSGATTLDEARRRAGFPIPLPAHPPDLGPPDRVFLQGAERPAEERAAVLLWLDPADPGRVLLSLHIFGGDFWIKKQVPAGSAEPVAVNGREGFWISAPHPILMPLSYRDRQDAGHRTRWVGQPTLVWADRQRTYRLEIGATLAEALAIAESLR